MNTGEEFLKHLRDALNHLYDPDFLRRSPLAQRFDVAGRFDTPSALQRILTEAIEDLQPTNETPHQSHTWRTYDLLFYRYVQQFNQREVADQLGVSTRQLRREQHAALETLAYHLWQAFDLGDQEGPLDSEASEGETQALDEELAWLKSAPPEHGADLEHTLATVTALIAPLAAQHQTHLRVDATERLPKLAMHPVALRQSLLNLLGVAIPWAAGEQVVLSVTPARWEVDIEVRCMPPGHRAAAYDAETSRVNLEITRQLARLCGGKLRTTLTPKTFCARLTLPALETLPVLIIDDNADTIQLLQRYAAGTRYQLTGARTLARALELVAQAPPQIIVLDVMMPDVDGWQVLGQLRQHPTTRQIPIVICTILAQEDLARTLGANGFVHKPVSRSTFLAALDRQVAPAPETESR